MPIFWATIGLMFFFVVLISFGISESSSVAIFIFVLHILSMLLLIGSALWYAFSHDFMTLYENFNLPVKGSIPIALFLGFSTAMLGISAFESSANFVEEQEKGVFRKTLRNMWIAVTVINPLMALALIGVIPIPAVEGKEEVLLAYMGEITGGPTLAKVIAIDAVLVLSGAVLTSFIGVAGLMKRMSLDRILPQGLNKTNKRGGATRILLVFFALCVSVLLITKGKLGPLAGVYTISFLAVMAYFGFGNLLLKIKRAKLPQPEYSQPFVVAFAIFCILAAIYGNVRLHPEYLVVFLQYFIPSVVTVLLLLNRQFVLQYLLVVVRSFLESFDRSMRISEVVLTRKLHKNSIHSNSSIFPRLMTSRC